MTSSFLTLLGCQPEEPEMIIVTEVVHLGDEQIIITRLVELLPTVTATSLPVESEPEPVVLDIAYVDDFPDLDPQHITGKTSLDLAESLFAGLTNFNHENQQIEPELAASWRISGDGLIWTFTLRDDVFWVKPIEPPADSDNVMQPEVYRPVNAQDVVFSIQRACTQNNNVPDAFLLFMVDGCEAMYVNPEPGEAEIRQLGLEVLDDLTVQVTLNEPSSQFLTVLSLPQFRPVPMELVEEHGSQWQDAAGEISTGWQTPDNIVINGPFVPITGQLAESELTLYRNPLWPLPAKGNVEFINAQFQLDELEMFNDWKARRLDVSQLPIEERDSFLSQSPGKALLVTNQTVFYLGFNFESVVFREPEVRRAFGTAIDRIGLIDRMFDGRGQGLRHFSPPGVFGAPPVNEVGVGYSPDFALHQMNQSSIRNCKLIPPVTLLVSTADLSLLQAELIRDMWIRELGCDEDLIQIEQVEFGTLLANTLPTSAERRPDMWELAWPAYYPDAHNLLTDLFHCTDGENRQNRACENTDRLMQEARLNPDPQQRIDLYRVIENDFFSESGSFPVIPLYVRGDYMVVQSWLKFPPALSGGEQFDTYQVDQELKRLERSRS